MVGTHIYLQYIFDFFSALSTFYNYKPKSRILVG